VSVLESTTETMDYSSPTAGAGPLLTVAVIGVGTAGVSAVKWCKQRGLNVVGFEKEAKCGGIWRHGTAHSPAYDSLYTNSSGTMMCLGDFDGRFKGTFPSHRETCEYYDAYMSTYDLHRLVRWNTLVDKVYKRGDKWAVEFHELPYGAPKREYYDRVIICAGKLWIPSLPAWVPKERLIQPQGGMLVLHSRDYRNPQPFAGKRVVVVGVGNSALDISLELARDPSVQKPILVSCRRGTVVMPIDDKLGNPVDPIVTSRAFQYLASGGARNAVMINNVREVNEEFRKYGLPAPPNKDQFLALENPVSNLKDSRGYLSALRNGMIQFVDGVTGFGEDGHTLLTKSGSITDVGAAIFCTGYRVGLDFLDMDVRSRMVCTAKQKNGSTAEYVDLYKNMVYAQDPTIAFLVYLTSFGNESVVGSMQARWITRFWTDPVFARKVYSFDQFKKESSARAKFIAASNVSNPFFVRKSQSCR